MLVCARVEDRERREGASGQLRRKVNEGVLLFNLGAAASLLSDTDMHAAGMRMLVRSVNDRCRSSIPRHRRQSYASPIPIRPLPLRNLARTASALPSIFRPQIESN